MTKKEKIERAANEFEGLVYTAHRYYYNNDDNHQCRCPSLANLFQRIYDFVMAQAASYRPTSTGILIVVFGDNTIEYARTVNVDKFTYDCKSIPERSRASAELIKLVIADILKKVFKIQATVTIFNSTAILIDCGKDGAYLFDRYRYNYAFDQNCMCLTPKYNKSYAKLFRACVPTKEDKERYRQYYSTFYGPFPEDDLFSLAFVYHTF